MPRYARPTLILRKPFVDAVNASGYVRADLIKVSGFKSRIHLCKVLRTRRARGTDLSLTRLQRLANFVGYTGPLFVERAR